MAKILENTQGRKSIKLSTDDVISIVKEYQNITKNSYSYNEIREKLNNFTIIVPEEIY
ncbi:MAG: hypothetical protein IJY61_01525 [Candidatus Gastranaerophilales bacterium]|nr:hypothetical protein [Candidatus Gastranaerophilales bacterium]